ncbi:MAG: methyltransferase domain-containing protein [Xanthobacteraceae bacterium]|nr:MAG: methyltransferase domain-containing protein [Xanthobacteraceae bacterium]
MSDAAPLFVSSGDLVADRRYAYARDFLARGDLAAAADVLEQALERAPDFAAAWFALGELREQRGDAAGAIAAFRRAREADPDDRLGAALHLMRLDAEALDAMPPAYVRAVFDQYAPRFDQALVEGLAYRGPQLLHAAVLAARARQGRAARFAHALDLGCGTGLAARAFAGEVDRWTGVDLSPGMVAQARASGLYAGLHVGDMLALLRDRAEASADLVIAADAVVYLPDHAALWREAARVLAHDGVLAFTVESHGGDGVVLGAKLRYAHGAAIVRRWLDEAGFAAVELSPASTRNEAGIAVPGLVVTAVRP